MFGKMFNHIYTLGYGQIQIIIYFQVTNVLAVVVWFHISVGVLVFCVLYVLTIYE